MDKSLLKNYRGRFPFKLSTTSYIYPDEIVPNVARLAPYFDEIELVLFESRGQDSIPNNIQIKQLMDLSHLHQVGFNVHLPIDISLGDERDEVRMNGISIIKMVIKQTLYLNPSFYTLHLDLINEKGQDELDIKGWRRHLIQCLEEILNDGIESKRISIETLGYPFVWIEDIVREFGFSICLDIGHILIHGHDLQYYLEEYLPGTSIVHLHGFQNGTDHLGIEKLPEPVLKTILSYLHHYHGVVSIEVFSIDELKSSLAVLEEEWKEN